MAYVSFGRGKTREEALNSENLNKVYFPTDATSIIMGGKEYGIGGNVIVCTQEFYNELEENDKIEEDKVYFIVDEDGGLSDYVEVGDELPEAKESQYNRVFNLIDGEDAGLYICTKNQDNEYVWEKFTTDSSVNLNKATVTVGGIEKGTDLTTYTDVNTLLKDILCKYVAPSKFSITSLTSVLEKGVEATISNIKGTWIDGSEPITIFTAYQEEAHTTELGSKEEPSSGDTLTLDTSISDTSSLSIYATITDGTTTLNANSVVTFVDPYYYGCLTTGGTPTSELILTLTKAIQSKASKLAPFTCTGDGYPVFAYPKSYGTLKSILDLNGQTATGDFNTTPYIVSVNVSSGAVEYYVYIQNTASTNLSNFKYTFNI